MKVYATFVVGKPATREKLMMSMRVFIAILLLLILTDDGAGFGRKRSANCRKDKEETLSANEQNSTADYYYDCDPTEFGIVQKIPYSRSYSGCDAIEIDFSSACIRCGMCLAVAEKINQTLLDAHEVLPSACINDTEIVLLLRTICDHCFQYHSLHEINGNRFIAEKLPGSISVSTSADGLWAKKLKYLCHYYLDEIGEMQLYEEWLQWCNDGEQFPNLSTVMCRSIDGVLRDCRSMGDVGKYVAPFQTYNAKIKIAAWFDGYSKRQ